MNESMKNPKAYQPVIPDYTLNYQARAALGSSARAEAYKKALMQFEVATNPRYEKGHDNDPSNGIETYCNIFLWDGLTALGLEPSHWVDASTGVSVPVGKGVELSANGVCNWFTKNAYAFRWMQCGENQARSRASEGFPTVVLWYNRGGIGHVAFVLPGTDFTHIAQAGGSNFFDKELKAGFGAASPLMFFTHD